MLAYIESYKGVKAGQRVWQLGFGSGFKVNSAVWVAKKRNHVSHLASDRSCRKLGAVLSVNPQLVCLKHCRACVLFCFPVLFSQLCAHSMSCACVCVAQIMHPAWENFDISKLHDEYAKLEAEKQAYLAAKAATAGKQ